MELSPDGLAILLLCSGLGLPPNLKPASRPLNLRDWNNLASRLTASSLGSPSALLGENPTRWQSELGLGEELATRIHNLLERKANLAIELERLSSMGIWVVTRADEGYPCRLKNILGRRCPSVFFGAGERSILEMDGVAVVGSRDVDEAGADFASRLGAACARQGLALVSGGARGIDQAAQRGALEAGGHVISVSAQGLEALVRGKDVRDAVFAEQLVLLSTAHPRAPFSVGQAMERNKYIYALSLAAVVVSSSAEKGGTWAGATENLKNDWVPLFVRSGEGVPEGNRRLLKVGANPIDSSALGEDRDLRALFENASTSSRQEALAVKEPEFTYPKDKQASLLDIVKETKPGQESFSLTLKSLVDVLSLSSPRVNKLIKELGLKDDPAMYDGRKYSERALQKLSSRIRTFTF